MFVLIFTFFVLGVISHRLVPLPATVPLQLNNFVIYVALPAVILLAGPSIQLDTSLLYPVLAYWLPLPLIWLLSVSVSRRLNWDQDYQRIAFGLLACGNTAYFGIPMVKTLMGDQGVPYALAYDQLGSFLGLAMVLPVFLATTEGRGTQTVEWGKIAKRLCVFPPFVTLMACLLLPVEIIVRPLEPILSGLGTLIIPLTMLALGMQFRLKLESRAVGLIAMVIGVKMVALPLLVFGAGVLFSIDPLIHSTVTLQSAMPPMISAAALLTAAGVRSALVAAVLSTATLWAFVEIPLLGWVLNTGVR